jgi:protein HIRA/HIR1
MTDRCLFGKQNPLDHSLLLRKSSKDKSWTSVGELSSSSLSHRLIIERIYRSWDGLTLYAASSDGTIAVLNFDPAELEGIASHSDQEQYLAKFGFNLPPLPEGFSHTPKQETMNSRVAAQPQQPAVNGFDARMAQNEEEKVNILVAKRAPKDKKRLNLLPTSGSSAPVSKPIPSPIPISTSTVNGASVSKRASLITIHDSKPPHSHSLQSPHPSFSNSFPLPSEQPFVDAPDSWNKQDVGQLMDVDIPMDVGVPISTGGGAKGKRKAPSIIDLTTEDNSKGAVKARTLGGDRPVEIHVPKEISTWTAGSTTGAPRSTHGSDPFRAVLPTPPLLTYLSTEVEGTDDLLESRNIEEDGKFLLNDWTQADVMCHDPFL